MLLIYLIGIPNLWWVEDQPYYCGEKEFLFKNLSKMDDNSLLFCYVNCARDHGCNITYNGYTWFDNETKICHCGDAVEINFNLNRNYNLYGTGDENIWENINLSETNISALYVD